MISIHWAREDIFEPTLNADRDGSTTSIPKSNMKSGPEMRTTYLWTWCKIMEQNGLMLLRPWMEAELNIWSKIDTILWLISGRRTKKSGIIIRLRKESFNLLEELLIVEKNSCLECLKVKMGWKNTIKRMITMSFQILKRSMISKGKENTIKMKKNKRRCQRTFQFQKIKLPIKMMFHSNRPKGILRWTSLLLQLKTQL